MLLAVIIKKLANRFALIGLTPVNANKVPAIAWLCGMRMVLCLTICVSLGECARALIKDIMYAKEPQLVIVVSHEATDHLVTARLNIDE